MSEKPHSRASARSALRRATAAHLAPALEGRPGPRRGLRRRTPRMSSHAQASRGERQRPRSALR
eukprot:2207436-Alexandrium_andersonii.AAC.1